MTFRARPVVKRPGRSGWDQGDRRETLINLAFVATIVAAILILTGYAGYSWWDTHNGVVAKVNGTVITKDQLRSRFKIETFRLDYQEAQLRSLNTAGHLADADYSQELSFLEQRRNSLPVIAQERAIDQVLLGQLAPQNGITVSDADIDKQIRTDATVPEQRHVWVIEFAPENNKATGTPGDAEKAAAKAKADAALAEIKGGTSFEDVAKAQSTGSTAAQGGDLGWLPQTSGYDRAFMDAVYAAKQGETTGVVEGSDGTYRIGRFTEQVAATVDASFQTKVEAAGIKMADYREAARADAIRTKLSDKVVADLSAPGKQRHVLEIFLPESSRTIGAVKVRHILFSPKHDAANASKVPASDPSWAEAQKEAQAAYDALKADPTKFDEMARTKSDETSAKSTGGKQPWYDPTSQIDKAFADAIFAKGLKPGDLIPPFKTSFGWHVVQFMRPYGDGDKAWMQSLKDKIAAGADFAQTARDQSEAPDAGTGGDMGWIARGQLSDAKDAAIFTTPVGGLSDIVTVTNEGTYLFKVAAEETRTPTPAQIAVFKDTGFTNWYTTKKNAAKIDRVASAATVLGQ